MSGHHSHFVLTAHYKDCIANHLSSGQVKERTETVIVTLCELSVLLCLFGCLCNAVQLVKHIEFGLYLLFDESRVSRDGLSEVLDTVPIELLPDILGSWNVGVIQSCLQYILCNFCIVCVHWQVVRTVDGVIYHKL